MAIEVDKEPTLPTQRRPSDRAVVRIGVDPDLYDEARRIADLRGQSVDEVVARALRSYARGRLRPRH
jgi:hypothetical protein